MFEVTRRSLATAALLGLLGAAAGAAEAPASSLKDIVLDRLAAPAAATAIAVAQPGDAMAVSVLLESPDGTLTPRGTDRMFHTGDRFRVKVLASRNATIALYNTNPLGVLGKEPLWQGEVRVGQEVLTPRLRLDGHSGVDHLHIVLQPAQDTGVRTWLGHWLGRLKDGSAKDISLDVQNTESATYLLNGRGQGLVTTMRIVHR